MASVPTQSDSQICKKRRSKKQQQNRVKMITGYIIYASEIRKEIIKKNPEKDFGGISKIVGSEWKNLPQETKVSYEKRAQEQNSLSRMVFSNGPLNKLADVAARAAEAEEMQANSCSVVVDTQANGLIQKQESHQQQLLHVDHQQGHQDHSSTSVDIKAEDSIDIDSNNNQPSDGCSIQAQQSAHREAQAHQQQQHLPIPQSYFQQHPQPPITNSSAANYAIYPPPPPPNPYCQYCYPSYSA